MISPWESSADAFLFAWKGLLNNSVTLKVPLKPPPSRLTTNNQKSPLRYIRPDTDTPPLPDYHLFHFLEKHALTYNTFTHVFKRLNQIVKFKYKK